MQLTVWTYEGPPHVGAMRVATAMKDVHYVLHAPQGDTYADLLFTMIERLPRRPPVTTQRFRLVIWAAIRPACFSRPHVTPMTGFNRRPCWSDRRARPN